MRSPHPAGGGRLRPEPDHHRDPDPADTCPPAADGLQRHLLADAEALAEAAHDLIDAIDDGLRLRQQPPCPIGSGHAVPAAERSIVVDSALVAPPDGVPVDEAMWAIAADQRRDGPGRLIVGGVDASGNLVALAGARRTDPIELGLLGLMHHLGTRVDGLAGVVAWCDEPVEHGPPSLQVEARFLVASALAQTKGLHLVDWIACDDELVRSARIALGCEEPAPWETV